MQAPTPTYTFHRYIQEMNKWKLPWRVGVSDAEENRFEGFSEKSAITLRTRLQLPKLEISKFLSETMMGGATQSTAPTTIMG